MENFPHIDNVRLIKNESREEITMSKIFISSIVLILLFVSCDIFDRQTDSFDSLLNPVIIVSDQDKELSAQTLWDAFITQYNATPDTLHTHFMKPTSCISQAYFENELPEIFSGFTPGTNNIDTIMTLLEFYSEWESLFGCDIDNIELIDSLNREGGIYKFRQTKIGNTSCEFVNQAFIKFVFTESMKLKSIISTLIPDVDIEIPSSSSWIDVSQMIENTIGYEHEFLTDASSIYYPQKHLFSTDDNYTVKKGFEMYPRYSGDTLSIYYLKGIEFSWNEDNMEYSCIIYYHPSTAEIIHVKKCN